MLLGKQHFVHLSAKGKPNTALPTDAISHVPLSCPILEARLVPPLLPYAYRTSRPCRDACSHRDWRTRCHASLLHFTMAPFQKDGGNTGTLAQTLLYAARPTTTLTGTHLQLVLSQAQAIFCHPNALRQQLPRDFGGRTINAEHNQQCPSWKQQRPAMFGAGSSTGLPGSRYYRWQGIPTTASSHLVRITGDSTTATSRRPLVPVTVAPLRICNLSELSELHRARAVIILPLPTQNMRTAYLDDCL